MKSFETLPTLQSGRERSFQKTETNSITSIDPMFGEMNYKQGYWGGKSTQLHQLFAIQATSINKFN